MGRNVLAEVSQSALCHNLQQVRKLAPNRKIIAMVKANAYGHGLEKTAKSLSGADALGVASIEEALRIRHSGVQTDIVLMEGIFRQEELLQVENYDFTLVVHHWPQVQALANVIGKNHRKFKVWLKINTGMNRLGFCAAEFNEAYLKVLSLNHVDLIGFMTHFSQADVKDHPYTLHQYEKFHQIVGMREGQKCLANSAGILAWPQTHADWVRPGLMLYGASPFADCTGKALNLIPAMTLRSEIIALREVALGETVGYGGTWKNTKAISKIGIIAAGYGDGYPWHAKNGTPVLVDGLRAQTVGRISMDMLAVDISGLSQVQIGSPVILWGRDLPIEEVAHHADTIAYELFCRFTERVKIQMIA